MGYNNLKVFLLQSLIHSTLRCNELLSLPLFQLGFTHGLQSLKCVSAPSGALSMSQSLQGHTCRCLDLSTATVALRGSCSSTALSMDHSAFGDRRDPAQPHPQPLSPQKANLPNRALPLAAVPAGCSCPAVGLSMATRFQGLQHSLMNSQWCFQVLLLQDGPVLWPRCLPGCPCCGTDTATATGTARCTCSLVDSATGHSLSDLSSHWRFQCVQSSSTETAALPQPSACQSLCSTIAILKLSPSTAE